MSDKMCRKNNAYMHYSFENLQKREISKLSLLTYKIYKKAKNLDFFCLFNGTFS